MAESNLQGLIMFKQILQDIFPILEKVAPTFATALGSPIAGVASTFALSILANKFGLNPKDVAKLPEVINADPECNDKLCEIENTFADWFKNNAQQIKSPSKAEINVKVEWDNAKVS